MAVSPPVSNWRSTRAGIVALALVAAAACAGSGAGAGPGVRSPQPGVERRGVPGFDTRTYPGADAMRAWRDASPYRWVGFYLDAPCFTDTSWRSRRAEIEGMGWGTAVIFVGEQDWASMGRADATSPPDSVPERCASRRLSRAQGASDAAAAVRAAQTEGFSAGTAIYLDVERVDSVSLRLAEYVHGWTQGVQASGRYRPALYAHARNAEALHRIAAEAAGTGVPLWVASSDNFDLNAGPLESGFAAARVWQGRFDVDETWGGKALRIDVNVASSGSPSSR